MCIQHKLGILNIWEVKPCKFLTYLSEKLFALFKVSFLHLQTWIYFLFLKWCTVWFPVCLKYTFLLLLVLGQCGVWYHPPPFKRPHTIFFLPESYSIILFRVPLHYYLFPGANILFLQGYLFNPIQQLNSKKVRSEQLWKKF